MDWGDPALVAAFEQAIDARVRATLEAGASRWGEVVSLDHATGTCVVDLEPDGEKTIRMHTIRPSAVGQEVRVEGPPDDRWIADVKGGGLVVGGHSPGDVFAAMREPIAGLEVLVIGQTITDAETIYPLAWANLPTGWRSGANLVLPNASGRLIVARDDMDGSDGGLSSLSNTLGATGGSRTVTLAQANLPAYNLTVTEPNGGLGHRHDDGDDTAANTAAAGTDRQEPGAGTAGSKRTGYSTTGITVASGGSGTAFSIEQPAIVANLILFLGVPIG